MVKQGRYNRYVLFWILLTQQVLCLILYRGKELTSFFFLSFFLSSFSLFLFFLFCFWKKYTRKMFCYFYKFTHLWNKIFPAIFVDLSWYHLKSTYLEYLPGIEYSRISHFQTLNTWRKLKLQIAPGPYKGLTAPHGSHLCWERFWLVGYVQSYLHFSHPD